MVKTLCLKYPHKNILPNYPLRNYIYNKQELTLKEKHFSKGLEAFLRTH